MMKATLEADPPHNARVSSKPTMRHPAGTHRTSHPGWTPRWKRPRRQPIGQGVMYMGEGGTIPFMAMLGDFFPRPSS